MADDSLALLTAHPEWALVLEAYRAREAEIRAAATETQRAEGRGFKKGTKKAPELVASEAAVAAPESAAPESSPAAAADEAGDAEGDSPGWSERLQDVAGIERTALSGIHGRLIAFGLLKCEVGPRSAGLVYRPSNQGKSALKSFQLGQTSPLAETA